MLLIVATLVAASPDPASAAIVDHCVVRSETNINASGSPIRVGVDAQGRVYELEGGSSEPGPGIPSAYTVRRYTRSGSADIGYGAVRFGANSLSPAMVVAPDGTVTVSSFEDVNRPTIHYRRIDPSGRLSTIRHFGRAGHYVSGVGAFDVGDRLLSGIVLVAAGGSAAVALVIDVGTGEVISETPVSVGGDIVAVTPHAFARRDGTLSIGGRAPVQLVIPSTHRNPRIFDLIDVAGAVVAVGSADVESADVVTPPGTVQASPVRPVFARYALDNPASPQLFRIGAEPRAVTGITSNGIAIFEEPFVNVLVGQPLPPRDIELTGIDLAAGQRTVVAAIDDGRTSTIELMPGWAQQNDGSMRIVTQITNGQLFLFDLWSRPPAVPQPGALTGQVQRLYRAYFDRSPDPAGMLYWRTQRASGLPIARVSDAFAASQEFIATYGALDDAQFVELVYRNVLGRSPDADGRAFWIAQLRAGSTQGAVMTGFSDSAEFVAAGGTAPLHLDSEGRVARLYRAYFKRSPDRDGFCFWAGEIERSDIHAVSAGFARSPEFNDTYGPLSDDQFVVLVYQNVLGRSPDAAGKAFWVGQLRNGRSRGQVMTAFSESPEFLLRTDTLPARS